MGEMMDANIERAREASSAPQSALSVQVAGGHYKDKGIQPVEYAHANNLDFFQGSVLKYITRWRDKGGIDDLKKARHFLDLYIELENNGRNGNG